MKKEKNAAARDKKQMGKTDTSKKQNKGTGGSVSSIKRPKPVGLQKGTVTNYNQE